MPVAYAYGYAHVSIMDDPQSLPGQVQRITDYYALKLKDICQWGDVKYDDLPVSGAKVPFMRRSAGKKLIEILRPGDHLIFDGLDRIWRSAKDFVTLMQYFKRQGIFVHIRDFGGCTVELDTPVALFTVMAAVAELENKTTSHRIRESFAHIRQNRQWANGRPMYGCRVVRSGGKRRLAFDPKARATMFEIVRLRDSEGKSFEEIGRILKPVFKRVRSRLAIHRMYRREKVLQELRIVDPGQIPLGKDLRKLESLVLRSDACRKGDTTPLAMDEHLD